MKLARYTVIIERALDNGEDCPQGEPHSSDAEAIKQLCEELQEGFNLGIAGNFLITSREVVEA